MSASDHSEPPNILKWGVLLAFPALCILIGAIFLPRPVSVDRARKAVDRSAFKDNVSQTAPTPNAVFEAQMGEVISIVGADLPTAPVNAGDGVTIKTYFKSLAETDRNWQVFMHIDLKGGRFRVHGDHFPVENRYPTSLWQKGEYVTDTFEKSIDADAPKGKYDVFIGLYIGDDRMPFTGGDPAAHAGENRIKLGEITIQ